MIRCGAKDVHSSRPNNQKQRPQHSLLGPLLFRLKWSSDFQPLRVNPALLTRTLFRDAVGEWRWVVALHRNGANGLQALILH